MASKVYYHLGSFEDSLTYALGAGELFDVNARNEYVDTTIGKAACSIDLRLWDCNSGFSLFVIVTNNFFLILNVFFPAKCIDFYTQQRVLDAEGKLPPGHKGLDPRLEGIVNRMFQRCLDDNQYRQALGLALETRRMDIFEAAIMQSVSWFLIQQ